MRVDTDWTIITRTGITQATIWDANRFKKVGTTIYKICWSKNRSFFQKRRILARLSARHRQSWSSIWLLSMLPTFRQPNLVDWSSSRYVIIFLVSAYQNSEFFSSRDHNSYLPIPNFDVTYIFGIVKTRAFISMQKLDVELATGTPLREKIKK